MRTSYRDRSRKVHSFTEGIRDTQKRHASSSIDSLEHLICVFHSRIPHTQGRYLAPLLQESFFFCMSRRRSLQLDWQNNGESGISKTAMEKEKAGMHGECYEKYKNKERTQHQYSLQNWI